MIIEAARHPDSDHVRVVDSETGEEVSNVSWVDTTAREYGVLQVPSAKSPEGMRGDWSIRVVRERPFWVKDLRTGKEYVP